jgi:EmrB/QacA subfamily drug resistance transporter
MKSEGGDKTEARHFLIILSVAFSSFMAGLNNYIVNVSLPTIANYFNTGTGEVSRIVLSYLLVSTSSLFLFGRLADRIGLKKVFITGYIVFTAGALLCGFAGGINMLVVFRLIQGAGGSMLVACGYAVIARFLPPDRIGRAYGITFTSVAVGIATGAPLGGLIAGYLSWHWIFFVNVPVGITAIVIASRAIPAETRGEASFGSRDEGFDIPGALLSFFGLAALLYGLNMGKMMGWTSPPILMSFALAIVLLGFFGVRERICRSPLLDFGLFRNLTLTYALLATLMAFMLLGGNAFLLPFYLQVIKHMNVQQTGLMLLLYSLGQILMTPYAGRLSDRVSRRVLCAAGMASASLCTFLFSFLLNLDGLIPVFLFLIWLPLSYAFFLAPNANRIMRLASAGRHGSASGLLTTAVNLSMILGVSIFDNVFSHALPGPLVKGVSLLSAGIAPQILLRGFSNAYVVGGFICSLAFLFSFASKDSGT